MAPEAPGGLHPGGGAGPPGGAAVRAPRVQQDAHGEVREAPVLCWIVFSSSLPGRRKGSSLRSQLFQGGKQKNRWVSAVAQ